MKYRIEIDINHTEIGCNPGPIEIITGQSKSGAINLAKYLRKLFGEKRVILWKDTSEVSYTRIDLPEMRD